MSAIPLDGDRSAKDVVNYPARHATDLPSAPVHHVPTGGTAGFIVKWDGSKWVSQAETPMMTLGTQEGDLSVAASPLRIYNKYGSARTITEVFLFVASAPTGAAVIVDVKVDGSSIFTGGNEPQVADGANTGSSTTIASPTWADDSYLTWEVTQIGSTLPGTNLVVHIIHK